uniref:Uncharacterized protein n=1 Tax=Anguilla anguilla TaxID=7936 RepID=A0A0E9WI17_ANGAN
MHIPPSHIFLSSVPQIPQIMEVVKKNETRFLLRQNCLLISLVIYMSRKDGKKIRSSIKS